MTRDELLARFAMEPNPSPAIRDADIEGALALTNRVGHVTSPYMERSLDAAAASRGLPWHQAEPGWLQEAVRNIQDEVGLMVCIALCLNTAPGLVRTPVPARGPGQARSHSPTSSSKWRGETRRHGRKPGCPASAEAMLTNKTRPVMIRICHVSRAEMESEVHRLASSTKTQILARMHEYREMDPVRITDGIAVTDRQRSVAMAFLTWCRRSGKSFGPANIDAVFTEFQADKAG